MIKGNLKKGEKSITGHIFSETDCINYNVINEQCTRWEKERGYIPESLLTARHKMFVSIINKRL